jgi:hypothetical protein
VPVVAPRPAHGPAGAPQPLKRSASSPRTDCSLARNEATRRRQRTRPERRWRACLRSSASHRVECCGVQAARTEPWPWRFALHRALSCRRGRGAIRRRRSGAHRKVLRAAFGVLILARRVTDAPQGRLRRLASSRPSAEPDAPAHNPGLQCHAPAFSARGSGRRRARDGFQAATLSSSAR